MVRGTGVVGRGVHLRRLRRQCLSRALVTAPTFSRPARPAPLRSCHTGLRGHLPSASSGWPNDCAHVTDRSGLTSAVFCAERVGKTGDIQSALTICNQSRFRRHCSGTCSDGSTTPWRCPADAEAVLEEFGHDALKDAPSHLLTDGESGRGRDARPTSETALGCVTKEAVKRRFPGTCGEMLRTVSRTDPVASARPASGKIAARGPGARATTTQAEAEEAEWCDGFGAEQQQRRHRASALTATVGSSPWMRADGGMSNRQIDEATS